MGLKITIDFETRSEADIKKVGAWMYSKHPSTEILCLAYQIGEGRVSIFIPDRAPVYLPFDLLNAIENHDGIVEAHNAFFEKSIWQNICVNRLGWPEIPPEKWECTLSRASAVALPRPLGEAGRALGLTQIKDETAKRIMLKLSKPRKPTKNDAREWHDDEKDFQTLFEYCMDDVRAEKALSNAIPELSQSERELWLLDQKINMRGIPIDRGGVCNALFLADQIFEKLNSQIPKLTGGMVRNITQRDAVLRWMESEGVPMEGLTARDVMDALKTDLPGNVRRVLEIREVLGKSSTKKLKAFLNYADDDDRIRGAILYHGAATGRWSGAGIQPQNLPRATIKNVDAAIEAMEYRDADFLESIYKNPMEAISSTIRSMIKAPDGKKFYCGDYSAIEARVLVWIAKDKYALKLFHEEKDTYIDMASDIYNKRPEEIKKKSIEREVGKRAILGLGYGMGWKKFIITCDSLFNIQLTPEFAKMAVEKYREKYSAVVSLWHGIENAAIEAVVNTGKTSSYNGIYFKVVNDFLYCRLPSNRRLAYHKPFVKLIETPWKEKKLELHFWGVDSLSKKWVIQKTYGGSLVENIVQGTARDFMANAMINLERAGYELILTVHDEILAETPDDFGSVEEFTQIMKAIPQWGQGCPINVEAWEGLRYKKG